MHFYTVVLTDVTTPTTTTFGQKIHVTLAGESGGRLGRLENSVKAFGKKYFLRTPDVT
jgi:hypothetical protein